MRIQFKECIQKCSLQWISKIIQEIISKKNSKKLKKKSKKEKNSKQIPSNELSQADKLKQEIQLKIPLE